MGGGQWGFPQGSWQVTFSDRIVVPANLDDLLLLSIDQENGAISETAPSKQAGQRHQALRDTLTCEAGCRVATVSANEWSGS